MIDLLVDRFDRSDEGVTTLVVRVPGPLPAEPGELFDGFDMATDGDDVLVRFVWPLLMVPDDPRALVRVALERAVAVWAAGWLPVPSGTGSGLSLGEIGETL